MKLLIYLSAILFTSCELVVVYDIPFDKPDIVANSIINPDSIIQFKLTESKFILDGNNYDYENPFAIIRDASLVLFENDVEIMQGVLVNNKYLFPDYYPTKGNTYRVEIEKENYKKVIAETVIPESSINFSIENVTSFAGEYEQKYRFDLVIQDLQELNYYEFSAYVENINYDYSFSPPIPIDTFLYPIPLITNDPVVSDVFDEYWGETLLFTDELFNGRTYSINLEPSYLPFNYDDTTGKQYATLHLILKNLNKELYLYKVSTKLQRDTEEIH